MELPRACPLSDCIQTCLACLQHYLVLAKTSVPRRKARTPCPLPRRCVTHGCIIHPPSRCHIVVAAVPQCRNDFGGEFGIDRLPRWARSGKHQPSLFTSAQSFLLPSQPHEDSKHSSAWPEARTFQKDANADRTSGCRTAHPKRCSTSPQPRSTKQLSSPSTTRRWKSKRCDQLVILRPFADQPVAASVRLHNLRMWVWASGQPRRVEASSPFARELLSITTSLSRPQTW